MSLISSTSSISTAPAYQTLFKSVLKSLPLCFRRSSALLHYQSLFEPNCGKRDALLLEPPSSEMSALYRTLTGQSQKSDHTQHTVGSTTSQPHPTLTRTTTTDPLTGTLNHLTSPQEHKLDEFKEKLLKAGWWSPDGVNGKPTHDDGTLL